MLAALNKKENLFEVSAQSPPPCKDYIHLSVTMNEVSVIFYSYKA